MSDAELQDDVPDVVAKEIEMLPIGDLNVHPRNPRDGDVDEIAGSIEDFGFYDPIIVQKDTRHILAGNHSWLAARKKGLEEVPVVVVEVDDDTALRMLLRDNRSSDKAGYHQENLVDLLTEIEDTEDGLDRTGYDGDDLQDLLDDLGRIPGGEEVDDPGADMDRADELREKWETEPGQLWQVGRHRLLCGDATDERDVERLLNGAEPRLMVTDPPYGVEYDPEWRGEAFGQDVANAGAVPGDDRADWREAWALSPALVAYVWHGGLHADEVMASLNAKGYEQRSQIIWAKPSFAISRGHYHWQHEPCWYVVASDETAEWMGGRDQSTIWDIEGAKDGSGEETYGHSTQKPIECHARPTRNHKGDIYEPFAGAGTGLVAAQQEGKTCYAMEINPGYTAIVLERCSEVGMDCELIGEAQ